MHFPRVVGIAVAAAVLLGAASAEAGELTVKPTRPRADRALRVSWSVRSPLATGWHYELDIIALQGGENCSALTEVPSTANPARGALVHFRASPRAGHGHHRRWCTGQTEATLYAVPGSNPDGSKRVARSIFRMYARA